jgi:hypothetical protein
LTFQPNWSGYQLRGWGGSILLPSITISWSCGR